MSLLFKNKYRTTTIRLPAWNYTEAGYYFVTICTKNQQPCFGTNINGQIKVSPIGKIVQQEWLKTALIRSYLKLDDWILMPDHFHGIIILPFVETPRRGVSTHWKSNSLGSIINQFKSMCTKRIRKEGYQNFSWQSRFYDHIIRTEKELYAVRTYIRNNPLQFAEQEEFLHHYLQKNI